MEDKRIFYFEEEGRKCLGFDTGLTSRAFAQAKLAELISESGCVVKRETESGESGTGPGSVELWRASGVTETAIGNNAASATMAIWGPSFEGTRLDFLLADDTRPDRSLAAVTAWLQAILVLAKDPCVSSLSDLPLWPCAVLIDDDGGNCPPKAVFFVPSGIARRCLMVDAAAFTGGEWYAHIDYRGADAVSFTAAAMLYRIFAGSPPFPAREEILLRQDIRESNFLPVRLAAPGLDGRLASLIQNTLAPPGEKKSASAGSSLRGKTAPKTFFPKVPSPDEFLAALRPDDKPLSAASFVQPLDQAGILNLEKEKEQFLKIKTATVKTRRFVIRNTTAILACLAAVAVVAIFSVSMARSRALQPTTAGMTPEQVIESYYNAIGRLDHPMMQASVTGRAGREDINFVTHLFVISRVRMAHEFNAPPHIISAERWREMGEVQGDSHVVGVTDLNIIPQGSTLQESADADTLHFIAEYIFWIPEQMVESAMDEFQMREDLPIFRPPVPFRRRDHLTLVNRNGNWQISEIIREEVENR